AAGPGMLSDAVKNDKPYVYVPDTKSNDVYVIDQRTFQIVDKYYGGNEAQHVVPAYDMRTLYVASDIPGASALIPIDPTTGKPGNKIVVEAAYNLYFTPDGQFGIVVSEEYNRFNFYAPHTWQLKNSLDTPQCQGIDHMDYTADGRLALFSCEFAGKLVV